MSMSFAQARDELTALVLNAWATTDFAENYVTDDRPGATPSGDQPWIRISVRHADGDQASLASRFGKQRWDRIGTVIVQLFTPGGQGLSGADTFGKILVDAFEGVKTPGGAWFRNTRLQEIGPDGNWFQVNILSDFKYDEVK